MPEQYAAGATSPTNPGEVPSCRRASTMRIETPKKRKDYDREFRAGAVRIVE